jgi:hypothetical protein
LPAGALPPLPLHLLGLPTLPGAGSTAAGQLSALDAALAAMPAGPARNLLLPPEMRLLLEKVSAKLESQQAQVTCDCNAVLQAGVEERHMCCMNTFPRRASAGTAHADQIARDWASCKVTFAVHKCVADERLKAGGKQRRMSLKRLCAVSIL